MLKKMGAHEVISLDDKLKKAERENPDGSLLSPSLIEFAPEGSLRKPSLRDHKNVYETDKPGDDEDVLSLPKIEDFKSE